jgi:hypothetical protein
LVQIIHYKNKLGNTSGPEMMAYITPKIESDILKEENINE